MSPDSVPESTRSSPAPPAEAGVTCVSLESLRSLVRSPSTCCHHAQDDHPDPEASRARAPASARALAGAACALAPCAPAPAASGFLQELRRPRRTASHAPILRSSVAPAPLPQPRSRPVSPSLSDHANCPSYTGQLDLESRVACLQKLVILTSLCFLPIREKGYGGQNAQATCWAKT